MRHCLSELRRSRPLLKRTGAAVLLTLLVGVCSVSPTSATGQSLSPSTYQQLTEVHELIDQQAYDAATVALQGFVHWNKVWRCDNFPTTPSSVCATTWHNSI